MSSEFRMLNAENQSKETSASFSIQHSAFSIPKYSWQLLRAGPILLDGGGMFGVIPRVIWNRAISTDDAGRITLAHNCLLLQRVDSPDDRVLIEVGSGDKFGPKSRKIFGLSDRSIINAVEEAGCRCEDIHSVIVSHLHFDHAGGLTRRTRPGEAPDWTGPSESESGIKLTFPRATIFVQRREWEDALVNRSVMTRTYLRDHLEPIHERLKLLNSPLPFPPAHTPDRDELPSSPVSLRETAVLPGITVFLTPGHTWGQQAIRFTDDRDRTIVFTPDVLPTVHHAGSTYNLAYDVEPYTSTITRHWFLDEAAKNDWLLVLDHEPGNPCQRVRPDGKGWYQLIPEEISTA